MASSDLNAHAFQADFDACIKILQYAVIPLFGSDGGGKPHPVGSAVLLKLGRASLMLTAKHVVDENSTSLYYCGSSGLVNLSRTLPAQLLDVVKHPSVGPKDRKGLEQQRELVMLAEDFTGQTFKGTISGE
jgi:hypothetical protein